MLVVTAIFYTLNCETVLHDVRNINSLAVFC